MSMILARLLGQDKPRGHYEGIRPWTPGQDDPIIHFYEDFLAAYDPHMREKRGVYYTPIASRLIHRTQH